MSSTVKRGTYLALATALISGISVYLNSYGVKQVPDPFVFTTAKNLLVGLSLAALAFFPVVWGELRRLSRRQWASLLGLGLIGGSIPFLLFFYGLKEATAPSAAFIHKTLFIWVAILAVAFLKERLGRWQILALATLIIGNLALGGLPVKWALGKAELLVLIATLLWAVEAVVVRKVIGGISVQAAALGRMGFGSLAMLAFLLASGRADTLISLGTTQWSWVILTSIFLIGYVGGYYGALKHAPATLVSSVLVLGSVITSLLYSIFSAKTYSLEQIAGFVLVVAAAVLWSYIGARSAQTNLASTPEVAHAGR